MTPRILLVDLNNFARYPTLAIGYLAAVLRQAEMDVKVFSPLMLGIKGITREKRPGRLGALKAQLNYKLASSNNAWIRQIRNTVTRRRHSEITEHHSKIVREFELFTRIHRPQVVMISTYLMYYELCAEICKFCQSNGIKVVIGGAYFTQPEVYDAWVKLPGLSGLIAGELELEAPALVRTLMSNGDMALHDGVLVWRDGNVQGRVARPFKLLDKVPFPDFSDFPWDLYPNRIIPIITGRGCQWGACTFCSDVVSTAGRTYRSRSTANVLAEVQAQYQTYHARQFVFTDLKLNSNPQLWRALIDQMQSIAPGSTWIASVHVGKESDNGLDHDTLKKAAVSGCVRLTTGLESGSQRVLDRMKKGTQLNTVSQFLNDASAAGISCRATMITGYPYETDADIDASRKFLDAHIHCIERVMFNRLVLIPGTPLVKALKKQPERFDDFTIVRENGKMAQIDHTVKMRHNNSHQKAMQHILRTVNAINNRALLPLARDFEGVM